MTIGDTIRDLRQEKGITQKDLARILHVSDKTISKWECGKSVPDIEMLKTLSEHFNVSVHTFFESSIKEKNETHALEERLKRLMWVAATFLVPLLLFIPVGYLIEGIIRSESVLQDVFIVLWILLVGLSTLSAMVLIGYSYITILNHHEVMDIKPMYRALHALLIILSIGVFTLTILMFRYHPVLYYVPVFWLIAMGALLYTLIRSTPLGFYKGKGFKVTLGLAVIALFFYLTTHRAAVAPWTKSQAFFVFALTLLGLFAWVKERMPAFNQR
ncbi:MAG: helix-turn-helix domain-containing protein [Bacillota bacterium]